MDVQLTSPEYVTNDKMIQRDGSWREDEMRLIFHCESGGCAHAIRGHLVFHLGVLIIILLVR